MNQNQTNETEKQLLQYLDTADQAVDPYDAAKALHATEDPVVFTEIVKNLEEHGYLVLTKKGKLLSLKAKGLVRAKIISQSLHFAFARPTDGGEDMFISEYARKGALLGDTVLLKNVKQAEKGPSGEVERIVEEGGRSFTGTVMRSKHNKKDFELKTDAAFRFPLPLRKGSVKLTDGGKIFAEVGVDKHGNIIAIPIKNYGDSSSAKVCADAIIDANGITVPFSALSLKEAAIIKETGIRPEEMDNRKDLRDWAIFTIDGEDSKDLDDAISVEETANGWKLGVHIADVSNYVRPGTALDEEAFQRGTSVYFADRVIPMLPTDISNGICSLNAGEDKLAFSALLTLDKAGHLTAYEFHKSIICSKVRGVYSEVNRIMDGSAGPELQKKYQPVMATISAAQKLAMLLKKLSRQRGTMDLDSHESRFFLDENGICVDIQPRTSGEAEELIEQMMIAANEAAALYAKTAGIPFVYRVHEEPSPDRVQSLAELAGVLGFDSRRLKVGVRASDMASLLEKSRSTKYSGIISHQLLRTLAKARYDSNPIGHFGLALADYCHFTSPIRRYPDLAIHRILTDLVEGTPIPQLKKRYADFVKEASQQSSFCEVRAQNAERSTEDCYAAEYMKNHIGEEYTGIISGVTEWGIYVELPNTAEGFIRGEYLPKGYEYDGSISWSERSSKNKITIGDSMRITVTGADVASGQVDFMPAL